MTETHRLLTRASGLISLALILPSLALIADVSSAAVPQAAPPAVPEAPAASAPANPGATAVNNSGAQGAPAKSTASAEAKPHSKCTILEAAPILNKDDYQDSVYEEQKIKQNPMTYRESFNADNTTKVRIESHGCTDIGMDLNIDFGPPGAEKKSTDLLGHGRRYRQGSASGRPEALAFHEEDLR